MICSDVEIEPALQDIYGEQLGRGSNQVPNVRLDIHACRFWENQQSAFFDRRLCHPTADSYRDLELGTVKKMLRNSDNDPCNHENEKKCLYSGQECFGH